MTQLEDLCAPSTSGRSEALLTWFRKRPAPGTLKAQLQKEARLQYLKEKNALVLDNAKLEKIWFILRQHIGLSNEAPQDSLNYDEFCQAGAACQEMFGMCTEPYFSASVFLRLCRDDQGAVALLPLFNYIMKRNAMLQTRVHLSCFDEDGNGWLSEAQLKEYLRQLVPELPGLHALQQHMQVEDYITLAARKFVMLHARNGRMQIRELLPSPALAELLQLRVPLQPEVDEPPNWFSVESAAKVLQRFRTLDSDGNGHLSQAEFAGFNCGTMTPFFISRIFEEHAAPKRCIPSASVVPGQMGFESFVDFWLAWDHRSSPFGARYFFSVLDLHHTGRLNQVVLYAFLAEIYTMWLACGQYPELAVEDVKDEIFDIVMPASPLHISLTDLMASGMAGTIISLLADVNLFWEYDNRETLLQTGEVVADDMAEAIT